ncbi:MAG: fibronectin type III domain-containing protein [Methanomassiliicoccales archaeon]
MSLNLFPWVSASEYIITTREGEPSPGTTEVIGDDITIGVRSANLTVIAMTNKYKVLTEEYAIIADYSTSFIEYQIRPYFTTDYIRYKRVNPQYAGDGTIDQYGNALDGVAMTITNWGQEGNVVWFIESCAEFSIKQSFNIYRDYFELDVTYKPGTKNVLTTYYIALCSSSGSIYNLMAGKINRYVPGFPEDTPASNGIGGYYPSFQMYAPACDVRVPGGILGAEWGFSDTVAYIYSPIWLSGGVGGASAFAIKYFSYNSIVPNIGLGKETTFHAFVRPYKYTDGKERGYNVGYAQWVAPKIASYWGSYDVNAFPLMIMSTASWSSSFRSWVESSQVKVATYSENINQINWNYKSAQQSNTIPDTPAYVPTSWQIYTSSGTPMVMADGSVMCNPVSGPYTTAGTYRWQLINNDPQQSWWTSSRGVFWDEINLWTAENRLKNDYQQRPEFIYDGYLKLMKESKTSGYWDYIIANSFSALLHLSMVADLNIIEGYAPSSTYGSDLTKHVWSTMNFVNNIPVQYRPNILVYQNYATGNSYDQEDVYSILFGAAKYSFNVALQSYDSYDSQMHNLRMAEEMFKAMGCTRDSDVRTVTVDTLDMAYTTTKITSADMLVMKGSGSPTITHSGSPNIFKLTNLRSSSTAFKIAFTTSNLYQSGSNVQTSGAMVFTTDGKGTYQGTIGAEKTGEIVKNNKVQVNQKGTGSIGVSLVSLSSSSAEMNLASTGGTTAFTLRGMQANTAFDIIVNGVVVNTVTSSADGTLSFERAFGTADVLKVNVHTQVNDTTKPTILSCTPVNGATGISIGSTVTLTFSEDMNKTSVEEVFALTLAGSKVSGKFSWASGSAMIFTPASTLSYSSTYTVNVGTGAKDLAGNGLAATFTSQFTTVPVPDTIKPNVISCSPSNGDVDVSVSVQVIVEFSEDMDKTSVEGSFSLKNSSSTVMGTFYWINSRTVRFIPSSSLSYYTIYTINVGTGAKDLAGNGLATTFTSQFTTISNSPPPPDPTPPGAPTNLLAQGGVRQITLSWNPPSSDGGSTITGYRIYRATSASGPFTLIASISAISFYQNTGLPNGATYYYRVSAVNSAGEGALSTYAFAKTAEPPAAPIDLSATPYLGKVSIRWSAPSSDGGAPIINYKIYRGTVSGAASYYITVGSTYFDDVNVTNGVTYYYVVAAVNEAGTGPKSIEVWAKPGAVPTEPIFVMGTSGDRQILLTWSPPQSDGGLAIQWYKIYRGKTENSISHIANTTSLSYLDLGLENGVTYFYRVSAVNGAGEGALSKVAKCRPMTTPSAPSEVQAIGGNGEIKISWSAPIDDGGSSIMGYCVYRSAIYGGWSFLAFVEDGLEYFDRGLANNATYFYLIRALNGAGEGEASQVVQATTSCQPPSSPLSLTAISRDRVIELQWTPPQESGGSPIIGYVIYRGMESEPMEILAKVQTTKFIDTNLTNGREYHYSVSAFNYAYEGVPTSSVSAIPRNVPGAPVEFSISIHRNSVIMSWSQPEEDNGSAILGYRIYEKIDGVWILTRELGANVTECILEFLALGSFHEYQLRAFNEVGEGTGVGAIIRVPDVPNKPEILLVKGGWKNVTLIWSEPSNDGGAPILEYVVYRAIELGPFQIVAILSSHQFKFIDAGLMPNVTYRYIVAAMNEMGTGIPSEIAQATVLSDPSLGEGRAMEKSWVGEYGGAIIGGGGVILLTILIIGIWLIRASKRDSKNDEDKGVQLKRKR